GHGPEVGLLALPPPRMADYSQTECALRTPFRLDGVHRLSGRQRQDEHDQDWDGGPCEFDRPAAVPLGWRAAVVPPARAEPDDAVGAERAHAPGDRGRHDADQDADRAVRV